jgi:hypothetical protein
MLEFPPHAVRRSGERERSTVRVAFLALTVKRVEYIEPRSDLPKRLL